MLGAIIGDIAGSRFEFNPTNDYNFEFFSKECSFTDDTICTVAVADALLKDKDFGVSIHEWCRRYPYPMGGYGGRFAQWVRSNNPLPYNSFGNGAAMRVSPVAWWPHNLYGVELLAKRTAECTHNHSEGIKGAQAVAAAIYECLFMQIELLRKDRKPAKDDIINIGLKRALELSGYNIRLSLKDVQNRFDETCQGTVPVALWIISESSSFEDAVRRAVSLGADADTLGAIVGSIAEAVWGVPEEIKQQVFTFLPQEMIDVVNEFYNVCTQNQILKLNKEKILKERAEQKIEMMKAYMFWKLAWGDPNVAMGLASDCPGPKRAATAEDCKTTPMSEDNISSQELAIPVTAEQMEQIRMGHIPMVQEDHWFMYCDDEYIRIFRSWAGMCMYEARYREENGGFVIEHIVINHELAAFGVNGVTPAIMLFKYLLTAVIGGDSNSAWQDYVVEWMCEHMKNKKNAR